MSIAEFLAKLRCKKCGSLWHSERDHCAVHPDELMDGPWGCWSCTDDEERRRDEARRRKKEAEEDKLAEKIAERVAQKLKAP